MSASLRHRGPDGQGTWQSDSGDIALSHSRLAIQDLTVDGAQPMVSKTGRYVISFNGEIYNFQSIRKSLSKDGCMFRGHSDTEVMLAAIERWGLDAALEQFVGMFAFALWDGEKRTLSLVRDRLGIKPLYYAEVNGQLSFASELTALTRTPGFSSTIDRGALALQLRHNYVPAPYSIYQMAKKLCPGEILEVRVGDGCISRISRRRFWTSEENLLQARGTFDGTFDDALNAVEDRLTEAVSLRMIADVPLGAFLSGGIDSSTVVALMQTQSSRPVKTFSIGFHEKDFDEAGWAAKVASHLGTDHHELYVSPSEAQAVVPDLASIYDEPFSDSSQIPTVLVSRLARKHVTVVLSGDGGDELFAGYKRYPFASDLWRTVGWMPGPLKHGLGLSVGLAGRWSSREMDSRLAPLFKKYGRAGASADKFRKFADMLLGEDLRDFGSLYRRSLSHWKNPAAVVQGVEKEPSTILGEPPAWLRVLSPMEYMLVADTQTYLPDDILTKVDRATMSVSLEARVPLLDHRVVELAWQLPMSYRYRGGAGKEILKGILRRHVPSRLIDRPKMGFGVPISSWLKGPLKDWASDLLSREKLKREGYFDAAEVARRWQEHLSGKMDWYGCLWDVLMFQSWNDARKAVPEQSVSVDSTRVS